MRAPILRLLAASGLFLSGCTIVVDHQYKDPCAPGAMPYCSNRHTLVSCASGVLDSTDCGALVCNSDEARCGLCGDGVRDFDHEVCDDGNNADGDGCRSDCQGTEQCGDTLVDSAKGETCDDGNHVDADGCEADCTLPACANGIVDPGELCYDLASQPVVGAQALYTALVDVDHDGDMDLATSAVSAKQLAILINDGQGGFPAPATTFPLGAFTGGVVAGDFDKDGFVDDVAISHGNAISFVENGTILHASAVTLTTGVGRLVAGDFDGNGFTDLAGTTGNLATNDTVEILLATSAFTFGAPQVVTLGDFTTGIGAGDFDGSNGLDLVVANHFSNNVSFVFNDGTGHFAELVDGGGNPLRIATGGGPIELAVGDFDGDGDPDPLTANVYSGAASSVSFLENQGSRTFVARNLPGLSRTGSVAIADFDRDGKMDYAIETWSTNAIGLAIFVAQSDGTYKQSASWPDDGRNASRSALVAGRVDADAVPDIVTGHAGADTLGIYLSNP